MRRLLALLFVSASMACSDDKPFDPEPQTSGSCGEMALVPLPLIDYHSDPFTLKNASIEGSQLNVDVVYGGGCGEAEFSLLVNDTFMESNPVQVSVVVAFLDNDHCKALVHRRVCFDLTKLAEHYQSAYQQSHGTVILRIPGDSSELHYTF